MMRQWRTADLREPICVDSAGQSDGYLLPVAFCDLLIAASSVVAARHALRAVP